MLGRIWMAMLLVVGLTATPSLTQSIVPSAGAIQTPFKLYRNYLMVVEGSIGPLADLKLLIDTGSPTTAVDHRLAKKLGVDPAKQVVAKSPFGVQQQISEMQIPDLRFGPIYRESLQVMLLDLSGMNSLAPIDAIVGLDVLGRLAFAIDYQRRTLTFEQTAQDVTADSQLSGNIAYLLLPIRVNGQSLQLVLDTAADTVVVFKSTLPNRPLQEIRTLNNLGQQRVAKKIRLEDVQLGDHSLGNLTAVVLDTSPPDGLDVDGFVGPRALGLKRLYVDFPRRLIRWD